MKKVEWKWDWGVYVPLCPHCGELAYEKHRCVFCHKRYKWVEGEIKPTVVEDGEYTIIQATNNCIQVYKSGRIILHASCTKHLSEDELRKYADMMRDVKKE